MNDEWLNAVRASDAKIGYGINWIAMRYSDILLMYAEVMNELYGADAANPLGNCHDSPYRTDRSSQPRVRQQSQCTSVCSYYLIR